MTAKASLAFFVLLAAAPPALAVEPLYVSPAEDAEARSGASPFDPRGWFPETTSPLASPDGRVKISGQYRLAAGADSEDVILNDANADLQERNFRYLFGERQNNTYDPAIYSKLRVDVDYEPVERFKFHTRMVADPWSWVGTTGEQVVRSDIGGEVMRFNLKYFGAFNSTLNEIYRTNVADSIAFPVIKVKDGRTVRTVVRGFNDFNPATNGIPFTIPELDIDYELRPFRHLWMDYEQDDWHARFFALADESQALTTDDPLGLSNHKDFWQQSPWLYQYQPVQFFSDGSIKRGYYSDTLSFLARDSEGNRLVLLRGASVEADFGKTYLASTVAAPYTPWDEDYFDADNVPGAVRLKHWATERLMLGGVYTFRNGLIDGSTADFAQTGAVDARYLVNEHVTLKGEVAASHRDREMMTDDRFRASSEGEAFKGVVEAKFPHAADGETDLTLAATQMDRGFDPVLSRYSNTRDDRFWGKHLTFTPVSDDLEPFRIGDGIDVNRRVFHARWKEKVFAGRFYNLFDVRHVRRASDDLFKENVLRDEIVYKASTKLTLKAMARWHKLPKTQANVEPFLSDFYFVGAEDPSSLAFQNTSVIAGEDPSRYTFSAAAQYVVNERWTVEGFVERTNDLPDFPRALLNSTFRDANDRVDGILIDHLTNFLYGQHAFGAVPPYEFFTVFRERVIWRPDERTTVTFHAAQNSYRHAAAIDDNVTHQGVSLNLRATEKLSFFADYTHSALVDVPKLIATNYGDYDYRDHNNVYASMDYRLNSSTVFRAEYGVFGMGTDSPRVTPYSAVPFSLPVIDTEHLLRVSLTGDF